MVRQNKNTSLLSRKTHLSLKVFYFQWYLTSELYLNSANFTRFVHFQIETRLFCFFMMFYEPILDAACPTPMFTISRPGPADDIAWITEFNKSGARQEFSQHCLRLKRNITNEGMENISSSWQVQSGLGTFAAVSHISWI